MVLSGGTQLEENSCKVVCVEGIHAKQRTGQNRDQLKQELKDALTFGEVKSVVCPEWEKGGCSGQFQVEFVKPETAVSLC